MLSKRFNSKIRLAAVLIIIVCSFVLAAHWPVLSAKALSFDDQQYFINNGLVQTPGLASARRFLTEILEPSTVAGYYQPLAMISLMLDYALGGRENNLMPFHRTSLILHVANTALIIVLLYLLFGQTRGERSRTIWVAAGVGLLFGVHPMTVEPIPWIGERKTLLAAFFSLWSLIFYVYSRTTHHARRTTVSLYVGSLVAYLLALMSKPTSTPLPVVMLLMDYWPLNRLQTQDSRLKTQATKLIFEKMPFFVLGGIFAIITYISQSRTASTVLPSRFGIERIFLVLCHNIIFYLYKMVWPVNLTSHYPFPEPLNLSQPMVLAGVIGTLVLIFLLVLSLRWTRAVLTGWLIFFIAVLPTMQVIGFTNVIASDKFAYLPSIGLLMALASFFGWLWNMLNTINAAKIRAAAIAVLSVLVCGEITATRRYLVYWQDSVSLHKYMLKLSPNSAPVHNGLGNALLLQGRIDEAIYHYRQAARLEPAEESAYNNLGGALLAQGKLNEAVSCFQQALYVKPAYADAYTNLGLAAALQGRTDEAIGYFRQALQVKPSDGEAHYNLGIALLSQGKVDDAISQLRLSIQTKPSNTDAYYKLGAALKAQGKLNEAVIAFRQALQLRPDWILPLNDISLILATHPDPNIRDTRQAIVFAERAAKLTQYRNPVVLATLSVAYAAAGRIDDAISAAEAALPLTSAQGDEQLANIIRSQLELYKKAKQ